VFIGHAAVGFAAKRAAPRVPLVFLLSAAYLADLLWPLFLLLGLEQVRIDPGNTAFTPLDFVSYPLSHSLLLEAVWGALLGLAYWAWRRDRTGAWWVGALVVSHWVLDFLVHRADLPLWPGGPKVGLGLWYSVPATISIECVMFVAGLAIYLGVTRAKSWAGHVALWSLVALLAFAYWGNLHGPPPPDPHTLALAALIGWVFVPWTAWIDATRATAASAAA